MTEIQYQGVDEDQIDTILSIDVDFTGTMSFKKPLMIKGRVSGAIVSDSDLYIDENAIVEAEIRASRVSVRGRVIGNVSASDRVDLFASCSLDGDIVAPEVTMETGCRFNGICTMTGKKQA